MNTDLLTCARPIDPFAHLCAFIPGAALSVLYVIVFSTCTCCLMLYMNCLIISSLASVSGVNSSSMTNLSFIQQDHFFGALVLKININFKVPLAFELRPMSFIYGGRG